MRKTFSLFKITVLTLVSMILIASGYTIFKVNVILNSRASSSSQTSNIKLDEFNKITKRYDFIASLIDGAQESQDKYGIKPSIIIAQGILESEWGESKLSKEYNNLFGIKGFDDNKSVNFETEEFIDGESVKINDDFEKFDSKGDSIVRHAELLKNGTKEDPSKYHKVLSSDDYKDAAIQLQLAGYATDPNYANKLIEIIKQYKLQQYD